MDSALAVRLFGAVEVVRAGDGAPLDLGPRMQRAVLAMLAVEPGRVVAVDRLIDELWAGEAPAKAAGGLQAYVSNLRKVLEPDRRPRTPPRLLLTREPGYLLDVAPGQVDLLRFTAAVASGRGALGRGDHDGARTLLEDALALWRGEPLAEFADLGFAVATTARLGELRASAVEDLMAARLGLGETAAVVPELEALVGAHPYRERSWGLLVLALYRSGRQADALGALRGVRERLAADLGIEPGPDLRRLEQAVFGQSADLDVPEAPAAPPVVAMVGSERLVARDGEIALLDERLMAARRGRGGAVVVVGEAGIGKTRLVSAVAETARARGMLVAAGTCVDAVTPPFRPWVSALRALGATAALDAPDRSHDPDADLHALHDRVVAALGGASEPVLVVLDDVHWADPSSLRLLEHVAREATALPLVVVATARPEPGSHPGLLRDTLAEVHRVPGAARIELRPFTADDVGAYLRLHNAADDPATVAGLLDRSGGNPFYLSELLRLPEHGSGVPAAARDVIERRVARLPEPTRELLRAASVGGRDVEVDVLAAVNGLPAEDVIGHLEPAVAAGLLAEVPDTFDYRFSHALVRDALDAGLSRLRRARLHLATGRELAGLPGTDSARLAHHFAKAAKVGGAVEAVAHASRAARQATAQLALTEAVQLWELALASVPAADRAGRCTVLTELGQARRAAGDAAGARRDVEEALSLAAETGDRAALVAAATAFGGPSPWLWRPYGVVDTDMVATLEDLLAGPLADRDRAALLGTLAVELHYSPRRGEAEPIARDAAELARGLDDPALLGRTLTNLMHATFVPGRNAERLRVAAELVDLPGLPTAHAVVGRVQRMACLLRAGDLAEWDRDLDRCEGLLAVARRPELESLVGMARTARRLMDGRFAEAEELLERFATLRYGATEWGVGYHHHVTMFTVRRGQGGLAEIVDDLAASAEEPGMRPVRAVAALAAAETGQHARAVDMVRRWGVDLPADWSGDFALAAWGLVAARTGVPDPARLYELLEPHAELLVVAGTGSSGLGSTQTVLAELANRLGRPERARDHAARALRTHRTLGLTYWAERSERLAAELA
ncbi:BTAD domain-containing putative transcriptional regulator [Actinomycetes bacterium KLBMP 9759]